METLHNFGIRRFANFERIISPTRVLNAGRVISNNWAHLALHAIHEVGAMSLLVASASFSKLNKMFFGYFDPENILLDNENK